MDIKLNHTQLRLYCVLPLDLFIHWESAQIYCELGYLMRDFHLVNDYIQEISFTNREIKRQLGSKGINQIKNMLVKSAVVSRSPA